MKLNCGALCTMYYVLLVSFSVSHVLIHIKGPMVRNTHTANELDHLLKESVVNTDVYHTLFLLDSIKIKKNSFRPHEDLRCIFLSLHRRCATTPTIFLTHSYNRQQKLPISDPYSFINLYSDIVLNYSDVNYYSKYKVRYIYIYYICKYSGIKLLIITVFLKESD
jgi:hypothetical protein